MLQSTAAVRQAGYQHRGRFRADLLPRFDNRGESKGDQFRYSLRNDGAFNKTANEVMSQNDFLALVSQIEMFLRQYGQAIYDGDVRVAPYRYQRETACAHCDYSSVCRFDPWLDPYRVLKKQPPTTKPE